MTFVSQNNIFLIMSVMQFSKYLKYSSPHVDLLGQDIVSRFLTSTQNVEVFLSIKDTLFDSEIISVPGSPAAVSSFDLPLYTDVCFVMKEI